MFAASHLSGVKTPTQFMPLSILKSDSAPIQFMPLSMPKTNLSRPIFIRMQPKMPYHNSSMRLRCEPVNYDVVESQNSDRITNENEFNCVLKFSSVDSAHGMMKMANFIRTLDCTIRSSECFEEKRFVIVLSAMGKTTNKLELAIKKARNCDVSNVPVIEELTFIKDLHLRTADELGIDREIVSKQLFELEQLLKMIASMKEMTLFTNLVSYGECMSTSIFAAYLNKIGVKSRQYDSCKIDIISTHDLTNVDIVQATYPSDWINDPANPTITSSLGKAALPITLYLSSIKLAKEGDKPVEGNLYYDPNSLETDTSEDFDISIDWDRNAIVLDNTRMFWQHVRLSKVYILMFLLRAKKVLDDWLSTL